MSKCNVMSKHTKAAIQPMIYVFMCAIFCVCALFGIQDSFCFGITIQATVRHFVCSIAPSEENCS